MKFLVIVSDFPKVTETFVLRNVQHYLRAGHAVEIVHLKPFREGEVVHADFADVMGAAVAVPWVSWAGMMEAARRPRALLKAVGAILRAFWRQPRHLAVSLALVPKALSLAAHCRRAGVDHLHAEFAGYPATLAWIAAMAAGRPFSFSAHAHDIFITQGLLAEKARDAAFVRAISDFNLAYLEALPGYPSGKTEVLRCGVSVPQAMPPGPGGGPVRILFVGALYPRKGVDVLIKAVADLPERIDWRLEIIGGGSQEAALKALAETVPGDQITFHGAQASGAVRAAMAEAHVVAVPSRLGEAGRSEGIPVVLMEAMALGRPVVASRLSGIPELVIAGETGRLVEPNDVAGLSAALTAVVDDPEATARMVAAGRARVAEAFDIDKTAAQLLARMIEATP